jgi:hypothetical protein
VLAVARRFQREGVYAIGATLLAHPLVTPMRGQRDHGKDGCHAGADFLVATTHTVETPAWVWHSLSQAVLGLCWQGPVCPDDLCGWLHSVRIQKV